MKKVALGLLLSSVLVIASACGATQGEQVLESGTVKVDGSSTVYPIAEAVGEEFASAQPNVKLEIGFAGTGGGFKKLISKASSF